MRIKARSYEGIVLELDGDVRVLRDYTREIVRVIKYQVVILFEPPQPAQFTQSWCGYTLRVVVVEKVEVVSCRQGRRFQPPLEVLAVSFLNLAGEQVMQELYMVFSLLLRQMSF